MIHFVKAHRILVITLSLVLSTGYGVIAALQPRAATAIGVGLLAIEGALFLLLWMCRRS